MDIARIFSLAFLVLVLTVFPIFEREDEENKDSQIFMEENIQEQNKVCFQDFCFEVEIAKTTEEKKQGLMFRESLDENKGMLFDFGKQGRHSFWMKNTLIPLDIIWIDKEKSVVFIRKNVQPCIQELCESISSDKEARYVLEINANMADKIGLSLGAKMVFDIDK